MTRTAALLVMLATLSACGSTGPENIVVFKGTIVAATDGSGFTAGQPIPDARITLRYTAPDLTVVIRDTDISDASGTFEVQSGPPSRQSDPDCRQLSITVIRVGVTTETLRLSTLCGPGAGTFEGIVIEVTPT